MQTRPLQAPVIIFPCTLITTSNTRRTLKEMLTMTQVHDIRKLYFEEGRTISLISRKSYMGI